VYKGKTIWYDRGEVKLGRGFASPGLDSRREIKLIKDKGRERLTINKANKIGHDSGCTSTKCKLWKVFKINSNVNVVDDHDE
jgi:hypothetical protein